MLANFKLQIQLRLAEIGKKEYNTVMNSDPRANSKHV